MHKVAATGPGGTTYATVLLVRYQPRRTSRR
jgi:hypothetical protein